MKTKSQKQTKKELKDPSALPHYYDILEVEDKHFINPSKATEGLSLPTLPQRVIAMMDCLPTTYLVVSGKALVRNRGVHKELVWHKGGLKPNRSKSVLKQALYNADEVEYGTNPTYRLLKSFAINKKVYNAIATVNPISSNYADCMEVVDWYIDSKMAPENKKNRNKR